VRPPRVRWAVNFVWSGLRWGEFWVVLVVKFWVLTEVDKTTQNCHLLCFVIVHDLPWASTLVLWSIQAKVLLRFCFVASYWWLEWLGSQSEILYRKTENSFVTFDANNNQVPIRIDKRFDQHVAAILLYKVQENYFFKKLDYYAYWHDHNHRTVVLRTPTPCKEHLHYDKPQIERQVKQLHFKFLLTLFLGLLYCLSQLDHRLNVAA